MGTSFGRMATRYYSANSQSRHDGEKLEVMVKLNSICKQDNPSTPTPKKKVNQMKPTPKDSNALFKQIVEDNTFPPFFEVLSSPV